MPILQASELVDDRQAVVEKVLLTQAGGFEGYPTVRHISPLVMVALQKANNPYLTSKAGFDAMGIKVGEIDAASFTIAVMPKTAEVLILLACTREELKRYTVDPEALADAALDLVDGNTMEFMAKATVFITEELQAVAKSKAVLVDEKPSAEALSGGGAKKKRHPTG